MRSLVWFLLVALVAGLAAGASAAPTQVSGTLLDTIVVPFGHPKGKVYASKVTLQANTTYTLVVSGTASITYGNARPDLLDAVHYFTDQPQPAEPLRLQKAGGSSAAALSQWAGKEFGGLAYRADHVYTAVLTRDLSATGRLQVFSEQGYTGNCAGPGVSCSGEFTIKLYGPRTAVKDTVTFLFTQGGPPPGSKLIRDMRTAGRGSITFVNDDPEETDRVRFAQIVKSGATIVREFDVAATRQLKLRLEQPLRMIRLFQADSDNPVQSLVLDLEVVSSTDPDCPARLGVEPRPARIALSDGAGKKPDGVRLTVPGCPHHGAVFTGSLGKGSRVNVAIVHKR